MLFFSTARCKSFVGLLRKMISLAVVRRCTIFVVLDGLIKQSIGKVSTRSLLACLFSFLLLITIALTSFLLLSSGNRIVGDVIAETAKTISRDLSREVTRFLETPDIVNINGTRSILAGRVDHTDDDSITRFFMDAPQRRAEYSVSSIYFAEPNGRFIGVEVGGNRQELDSWNVSISSHKTQGIYTDFEVNTDGSVGKKIGDVKPYDPRVRPWYVSAIENPEHAIWTDVYTDFNTNLATLTRAQAVQNEGGELIGVLAVDLFLEHIQTFLSSLDTSPNSEVFIVNEDGLVLAAHAPGYIGNRPSHNLLVPDSPFQFMPYAIAAMGNLEKITDVETGEEKLAFTRGVERTANIKLQDQDGYLYSAGIGEAHGVNWTLGVFIPNSDFLQSVDEQMTKLLPLAIVGLLLIGGALRLFLSVLIRPLEELRKNANKIACGDFGTEIDTSMGNEVGELARSIDTMRNNLHATFAKLESNCNELSMQKLRVESTLWSISDGVVSIDRDHNIVYMNPAAKNLTGHIDLDLQANNVSQIVKLKDTEKNSHLTKKELGQLLQTENESEIQGLELLDKGGVSRHVSFKVAKNICESGMEHGSVILLSDLTEKIHLTNKLVHQAAHDELTGLVNRREFERLLEISLQETRKESCTDTLLYLDLDRFKIVNDSCGHIAGDELLRQIANKFLQCVRVGDVVARLGGDEFGIILKQCSRENGNLIATKILSCVKKFRFDWQQRSYRIGVSIGLMSLESRSKSVESVLSDVDSACYQAKDDGRNSIREYIESEDSINERCDEFPWIKKIDQAIEQGQFVLHAQNILPTSNCENASHCFEVLVRMVSDTGEFIPPGSFLPAAERYNLASKIDHWVVENTFDWMARNLNTIPDTSLCFINLSSQSINVDSTLEFIINSLERYDVSANQICFEFAETATIANLSTAKKIIKALRDLGFRIALDDFGSGLSSFEYLKNLEVDYLKIDSFYVQDIVQSEYDQAIVSSITKIGHTLGLKVIAVFVESDDVAEKMKDIGVDYVQGFDVSTPHPLDDLIYVQSDRSA